MRREPLAFERKADGVIAKFEIAERYAIGVSGGRDSVALLHFLAAHGFRNLIVCHLDHGLRGKASSGDAKFVERLAKERGYEPIIKQTDVAKLAREKKLSVETAARHARYEFFAEVARAEKCGALFLAHHADDQVETFLFNLFRGAGTFGLGGMQVETTQQIARRKLRILRPLLAVWRGEIDEYVGANALKFREDGTNAGLENTRSRMRHEIIPAIEAAFGRGIRKSIFKTAEILRMQQDLLKQSIGEAKLELSIAALRAMPDALQSLVIHQWLRRHEVPNVTFDLVQSARSLVEPGAKRAKINLPGGRHVRRRAGKLFVE